MTGSSEITRRLEDPALLTGQASFVADVVPDDAAAVHYVTSQIANGCITSIDTAEASAAPGVLAVVTARDLAAAGMGPVPGHPDMFPAHLATPVLADEFVRFVGQPIVAVVARTMAEAADAAELVRVDIDPLPAVVGIDAALTGGDFVHPELGSNVYLEESGGAETAFVDDEVLVETTIFNNRVAPCPMEPRVAAAWWDDDGRLVQRASAQTSHGHQVALARWYGLEREQVRVITADVGGSFGSKRLYAEELLLGLLAERTGRPVLWAPARSADMVGLGHSRNQRHHLRITGRRDGTITGLDVHVVSDSGAFPLAGPLMARNTTRMLPGPHALAQVTWRITAVATNTTPIVAYRGAGRPESGALLDRAIDLFAAEAGLDPYEVRRINLLGDDVFPYTNPTGLVHDSGRYRAALELCGRLVRHDEVRTRQQAERADGTTVLTGLGYSVFIDRTAGIAGTQYGAVQLTAAGTARVLAGLPTNGQGYRTMWAQIVAERTGIAPDDIEVVFGDTDDVPRGSGIGGSKSIQKLGSAVAIATDGLVAEVSQVAASLLECAVEDVVLDVEAGRFHVAGAPGAQSVGWVEVATAGAPVAAAPDEVVFQCEEDYDADPTVPYGAYAVEVGVDTETGEVEVRRVVSVDDAGTIVNETLALGQVHGGIAQGIGQALYEDFVYDDTGNPITSNFMDYGIPAASEMPSFDSHLMQTPSPQNHLGAKGIAESGTIGATPALQNAVVDALAHLGVRHIDLPLTAERVWRAVSAA